MTTYGIVVEGIYDEAALAELIKKCLSSEIRIISRPCGGKTELMKAFPNYLESFRDANQGAPVDKALVIRDADDKNPDELVEKMKSRISARTYPFEVQLKAIVQELETWLLADEQAISRVTQVRSGRTASRVNDELEAIQQPKERLKRILSEAKVAYTPEVAREIAKELDLSVLEYRCPNFREFREAVTDC